MAEEKAVRRVEYSGTNEVTVEFVDLRNRPVIFGPLGRDAIRSRWNKQNLISDEHTEVLDLLPEDPLPGMRITLNIQERTAKLWDPLGTEEYKSLFEATKDAWNRMYRKTLVPQKGLVRSKMSDTDIKTWIFEILKMASLEEQRDGQGRKIGGPALMLISGKLPLESEIKQLPGQIRTEHANTSTEAVKTREAKEAKESSQK